VVHPVDLKDIHLYVSPSFASYNHHCSNKVARRTDYDAWHGAQRVRHMHNVISTSIHLQRLVSNA
jgi:hypothetical protein